MSPQARLKIKDPALRLAAFQQTGIEQPTLTLSALPGRKDPPARGAAAADRDGSADQSDLSL